MSWSTTRKVAVAALSSQLSRLSTTPYPRLRNRAASNCVPVLGDFEGVPRTDENGRQLKAPLDYLLDGEVKAKAGERPHLTRDGPRLGKGGAELVHGLEPAPAGAGGGLPDQRTERNE
jgi:hypothetical protein